MIYLKGIYRLSIVIGMIENPRYIEKCYTGLIQEVNFREKSLQLLQGNTILIKMI